MHQLGSAVQKRAFSAYQALHFSADGRDGNRRFLIEMLLDGLAASLSGVSKAHMAGNVGQVSSAVLRASRIVIGLQKSLDPKAAPQVSEDLSRVYQYFLYRLNRAHRGDPRACAEELLRLTNILRSAFSNY
jgi:flagellar protein FliS